MTKEELKEAIAATITENGQKGITGQALANLLNEIVDAAGEGSGEGGGAGEGGGGALTLKTEIDTSTVTIFSRPNEENALVYQTIVEGAANGVGYPVTLLFDLSSVEPGAFYSFSIESIVPNDDFSGLVLSSIGLYTVIGIEMIELYEDGSISVPA